MYCVGDPRNCTVGHPPPITVEKINLGIPLRLNNSWDRKPSPGAVYVRPLLCLSAGQYCTVVQCILSPGPAWPLLLLYPEKVQDRRSPLS